MGRILRQGNLMRVAAKKDMQREKRDREKSKNKEREYKVIVKTVFSD